MRARLILLVTLRPTHGFVQPVPLSPPFDLHLHVLLRPVGVLPLAWPGRLWFRRRRGLSEEPLPGFAFPFTNRPRRLFRLGLLPLLFGFLLLATLKPAQHEALSFQTRQPRRARLGSFRYLPVLEGVGNVSDVSPAEDGLVLKLSACLLLGPHSLTFERLIRFQTSGALPL